MNRVRSTTRIALATTLATWLMGYQASTWAQQNTSYTFPGHVAGAKPQHSTPLSTISIRMPVGDSLQDTLTSPCTDSNGNPIIDTVTYSVTKQPTTGGATVKFSPNPVASNVPTTLTITTSQTTLPSNYPINIISTGNLCNYNPSILNLSLAPIVNGGQTLWWFNGQSPTGYKTNEVITAIPTNLTAYQWKVASGVGTVLFDNNSSSKNTTTNTQILHTTGTVISKALQDVAVTVTSNGVTSDPVLISVLKPSKLVYLSTADTADPTYGYSSTVHYHIVDQLGAILPYYIGFNEQFTGAVVIDYAGSNWRPGPFGGNTQNPTDAKDVIDGEALSLIPTPRSPMQPRSTVKVNHWAGQWFVGSNTSGSGVKVQTNTWQKYLDHARHVQIVSPAQ